MVKMEETIRELKKALQFKQINSLKIDFDGGQQTQPYHLSIADEKIEELTRATAILAKNKDKDQRVLKMQKKIFDKNLQEMHLKVAYLENLIKEKDKEVKM